MVEAFGEGIAKTFTLYSFDGEQGTKFLCIWISFYPYSSLATFCTKVGDTPIQKTKPNHDYSGVHRYLHPVSVRPLARP